MTDDPNRPRPAEVGAASASSGRGVQTRERILETALEMFRERGYAATTMRSVATAADVSVGSAYYHFGSKAALIQGFYDRIGADHDALARRLLVGTTGLSARLAIALDCWIDLARPYHAFAGTLFADAADPTSPLSPFSGESTPARGLSIALYSHVLEGSDARPDDELARHLPELLWLVQMGLVLHWVHDRSEDTQRTRALALGITPVVQRLVGLSRLRVLRPLTRDVLGLLDLVRGGAPSAPPSGSGHTSWPGTPRSG